MKKLLFLVITMVTLTGAICQVNKSVKNFETLRNIFSGDYPSGEQKEALNSLIDLAETGNKDARIFLGCEYIVGARLEQNNTKGLEYLSEGAAQGSTDALYCLARYYYRENEFNNYISSLERCMAFNDLACKVELGSFLLDGRSVNFNYYGSTRLIDVIDIPRAFQYLEEASNDGASNASFILGREYFRGKKVVKDIKKAKYYLRKCIEDEYCTMYDMALEYLAKIEDN